MYLRIVRDDAFELCAVVDVGECHRKSNRRVWRLQSGRRRPLSRLPDRGLQRFTSDHSERLRHANNGRRESISTGDTRLPAPASALGVVTRDIAGNFGKILELRSRSCLGFSHLG